MMMIIVVFRISAAIRVKSAMPVKISDTMLIKRLLGIVSCFALFLSVRMVYGRPHVEKGQGHCYYARTHARTQSLVIKSYKLCGDVIVMDVSNKPSAGCEYVSDSIINFAVHPDV